MKIRDRNIWEEVMNTGAIIMMSIGCAVVWGGLLLSIIAELKGE